MKIEIIETTHGYFVQIENYWEEGLTRDEALGAVASFLYTGKADFLKDRLQHALWEAKYGTITPRLMKG